MIELIALTIFILSLGGIVFIIYKKLPVLNTLSHSGTTGFKKHHYILELEQKAKATFLFFEKQIWLHKFLSWVKCIILKIEVKIDHLLHDIRKKAQEKKKK